MSTEPSEERVALAESFLQEAVYRSRGDQAGATLLAGGAANCGLGEKPSVALDLTPKAEEHFRSLFGETPPALDGVEAAMARWVKRQDALDRKRNHFLRDFRAEHGADRRAYAPETRSAYEAGLDAVNAEVTAGRRAAALELLGL
ncbi:MAG: hypothetical protein AAFU73_20960 [Planctomycetota bacterium]